MRAQGHTVIELLIVVAVLVILSAIAVPNLKAYVASTRVVGTGLVFKGAFRKAHAIAVARNVETALRFEEAADGWYISTYIDGNHNGVLSRDIEAGVDTRLSGPTPLTAGMAGVRVAINPDTPAVPPETGMLDTSDPIRFGRSNMVSFSPLGTASPGTLYLAGDGVQVAVRVTASGARVRLLAYSGGRWIEK